MELRTESPRKYVQTRLVNHCAQCGEMILLPEWSEYLDRHRVRHLWECEACGYKFETLVSFPEREVGGLPWEEPPAVPADLRLTLRLPASPGRQGLANLAYRLHRLLP